MKYFGESLNVSTAVEFIENAILVGKSGFTVNTEFGIIAVEINELFEEPVIAVPWIDAPSTKWSLKNRMDNYDFYIAIRPAKSDALTHARVVRAISRCILMLTFKDIDMSEDIIDATTKIYLDKVDGNVPTINATCVDYALEFINPILRHDISVKNLIRELIIRRDEAANKVIRKSEKFLNAVTFPLSIDPYKRSIIGILLFVHDELNDNLPINIVIHDNKIFINNIHSIGTEK